MNDEMNDAYANGLQAAGGGASGGGGGRATGDRYDPSENTSVDPSEAGGLYGENDTTATDAGDLYGDDDTQEKSQGGSGAPE